MGISIELKKSSRELNITKPVQEKVFLPPLNRIPKPQDRSKVKNPVDPPRNNLRYELTKDASKSSGNQYRQSKRGNSVGDGELVRHMSNLPEYLKRVEKGENFQDNVLNVGVLDWTRLEKWKHGKKYFLEEGSTSASCNSSNSSLKTSTGSSRSSSIVLTDTLSEQQSSSCSSLVSSGEDNLSQNVKGSVQNVVRFQDTETSLKSAVAGRKNVTQSSKAFGRSHSSIIVEKEKIKDVERKITSETGRLPGRYKSFGASLPPKENSSTWDGNSKKTIEVSQGTDGMRMNVDQKIVSEVKAMSSKVGSYDVSNSSKEKKSSGSFGTKIRAQDLRQLDSDLSNQCVSEKGNSIVLLLPKESPQKRFREVFPLSQRRKSFDQNTRELSKNSFSDSVSTKEINSSKPFPEIPHSCPLPSAIETSTITISNRIPNGVSDHSMELSSPASHTLPCSEKTEDLHSKGKYVTKKHSDIKGQNPSVMDRDPVEILNQEATGPTVNNSRNPSPLRRFSFSLGRMGRSLSFKEGLTVPQLSSTHVSVKSGPVSSDASDCGDYPNKEKVKGHNRARSSPLRRLLDPMLKHKEANPPHHSGSVLQSKGSFNSFSGPVYSFPNEKVEECQVQALLQLRINNGLPLFRFVVNNNSNILAATMKKLTSSGKDDSGRSYTFYLVNEIQKKSGGWMSQGSKVKSCGYVYNVVGQMKVSNSDFSDTSGQDTGQYMLRESVLFGVERKQTDQGSPKFIPNRELAAAVVKIPREEMSRDEHQTNEKSMETGYVKCFPENQRSYKLGENVNSNNVTVILPGGVHSSPIKGEPSPLIHRWKFGGSCDCGGWDLGCKLQVLSDNPKGSKTFGAGPFSDCLELYVQGVEQQGRPILSLVPSKDGTYSVEYNTSISRLQAFFICVAVLSSQKSLDLSSVSNVTESKAFDQSDMSGNNGYQVKLPVRYAPNPPLSPVGRV